MQTKRPARISTDRAKSVRPSAPGIVLWRPDIVLASGAILASLAWGWDAGATRVAESATPDGRSGRDRLGTFPRVSAAFGDLLTRPAIHVANSADVQVWR